jgi:hypothetical protein
MLHTEFTKFLTVLYNREDKGKQKNQKQGDDAQSNGQDFCSGLFQQVSGKWHAAPEGFCGFQNRISDRVTIKINIPVLLQKINNEKLGFTYWFLLVE